MFMTNSRLLRRTLDSSQLPLVIKPKVVKETLQWGSVWPAQAQTCDSRTELTSELNLQCNYFTLIERRSRSKNN